MENEQLMDILDICKDIRNKEVKVPVDIIDFNNLLDICKDIRNKEVEIITLDNEQMEILPVDPKDFNKKMEKLKKFSENLPKETSLPKFRTSVGFLERIVSMSSSWIRFKFIN